MKTVYVKIKRGEGDIETRGVSGTDDEIDEAIYLWATKYEEVSVLDASGEVNHILKKDGDEVKVYQPDKE